MNNSSNTSFLLACTVTEYVLRRPHLVPLLYVELFLGIGAVLLNLYVIVAILNVKAFHSNLRCLLAYFSVCLAWFSLSRAYKAGTILTLIKDPFPCDSMKTAFKCGLNEILITLPSYLAPWSFFGVCLERLYATIHYKTYDASLWPPWKIVAFITAISITPIASNVNIIILSPDTQYTPLCEGLLSPQSTRHVGTLWLSVATVLVCLISAVCCKFWNDYKTKKGALNRALQTLTSRFQIAQNVQINRMLLPTIVLQTLCYAPHYIMLALLLSGLDISVEIRSILTNCNYTWRLAYALLHPLLAFYSIRALRQQLPALPCTKWKTNAKVVPNPLITEAKLHFVILEAVWEKSSGTKHPA